MAKFCVNCGNPYEEGTAFCEKCGTKLGGSPQLPRRQLLLSWIWITS